MRTLINIRQSSSFRHNMQCITHRVRSKVSFRQTLKRKIESKMASEQVIVSKAIAKAVAEATKVTIQAMAVAARERPQSAPGPKIGGPAMKQPTFNWDMEDKYNKPQTEQLAIVKNWLGRKGLQFLESLTNEQKVMCSMLEGLFKTLTNKFRLHFNETIKSLQFHKLSRQDGGTAEEWMSRL